MLEALSNAELQQQWSITKARLKSHPPSPQTQRALAKQLETIGDLLNDRGETDADKTEKI